MTGRFLVQSKQVPLNKNGKPYIAMTLMDRTGTIEARVWDNVEQLKDCCDSGDFVEIGAEAVAFQGRVQLKVRGITRLDPDSVDLEEYLPASPRDRGEMLARVRELIDSMQTSALRSLLIARLDDKSFREQFSRSPAAKTIHHAYLGGLLEHTLSVMELAVQVSSHYAYLDRDLLLAGAFFHDVGKIRELGSDTSFDYTDEGRLVGHLVTGAMMVTEWAISAGLDDEQRLKLVHMILSHHGSYEFGSPRRPKFIEAVILHYLDEMDSKVQTIAEIAAREKGNRWSSYQRLFDRYLLLGDPEPVSDRSPEPKPVEPATNHRDEPLSHRPLADLPRPPAPGSTQPSLFPEKK